MRAQPQLSDQLDHPTYRRILLTLMPLAWEPAGNMYLNMSTAECTVVVYHIYSMVIPG